MRISRLKRLERGDRIGISAHVEWEDCERPAREIFVETEARFGSGLSENPNAFLLAAMAPAAAHGEQRVRVDGSVCPWLREGITTSFGLLRRWYPDLVRTIPAIECDRFAASRPAPAAQAACTMSGGIDSLATLRRNLAFFPTDHPASIRTCFVIYGIDVGGYESLPGNEAHFDHVTQRLTSLAEHAGVSLVSAHTNLRHLDDSDELFSCIWFGSALAAVGHAFRGRISTMYIPSGNSADQLGPQGSHPLLDPHFSSSEVGIVHDGFGLSRLDKVGLVASWPEALASLRSCFAPFRDADVLNCGKCEKCLRTMTELLIHGRLAEARTFPFDDLRPEQLEALLPQRPRGRWTTHTEFLRDMPPLLSEHASEMWDEMAEPLRRLGRDDLAEIVERKVRQYRRSVAARTRATGRLRALAEFDRRWLRGGLRWMYRRVRRRASGP